MAALSRLQPVRFVGILRSGTSATEPPPMFVILAMLVVDDPLMAVAKARTSAEQRCVQSGTETDITVCGLRGADRFRVPFVVHDPGDPAHESVANERTRLLRRTSPLGELSPFQVGGGMAGVTATFGSNGSSSVRKPAP